MPHEGVRMESQTLNPPRGNNAQRPNMPQIGQIRQKHTRKLCRI